MNNVLSTALLSALMYAALMWWGTGNVRDQAYASGYDTAVKIYVPRLQDCKRALWEKQK